MSEDDEERATMKGSTTSRGKPASSGTGLATADAASTKTATTKPSFVTELNKNDVLVGRGAPSIDNEGNRRFRAIVQSRKNEYVSTGKRQHKDWIARQIIHTVSTRGGRFLRKIESLVEAEQIGVPEGTQAWTIVDDDTILNKVKQALRDRDIVTSTSASNEQQQQQQEQTESRSPPGRRARRQGQGIGEQGTTTTSGPDGLTAGALTAEYGATTAQQQHQHQRILEQVEGISAFHRQQDPFMVGAAGIGGAPVSAAGYSDLAGGQQQQNQLDASAIQNFLRRQAMAAAAAAFQEQQRQRQVEDARAMLGTFGMRDTGVGFASATAAGSPAALQSAGDQHRHLHTGQTSSSSSSSAFLEHRLPGRFSTTSALAQQQPHHHQRRSTDIAIGGDIYGAPVSLESLRDLRQHSLHQLSLAQQQQQQQHASSMLTGTTASGRQLSTLEGGGGTVQQPPSSSSRPSSMQGIRSQANNSSSSSLQSSHVQLLAKQQHQMELDRQTMRNKLLESAATTKQAAAAETTTQADTASTSPLMRDMHPISSQLRDSDTQGRNVDESAALYEQQKKRRKTTDDRQHDKSGAVAGTGTSSSGGSKDIDPVVSGPVLTYTTAERAIAAAVQRARANHHIKSASTTTSRPPSKTNDSRLSVTLFETFLLVVLTSYGMPIWDSNSMDGSPQSSSSSGLSTTAASTTVGMSTTTVNPMSTTSNANKRFQYTWSQFGSLLIQTASEFGQKTNVTGDARYDATASYILTSPSFDLSWLGTDDEANKSIRQRALKMALNTRSSVEHTGTSNTGSGDTNAKGEGDDKGISTHSIKEMARKVVTLVEKIRFIASSVGTTRRKKHDDTAGTSRSAGLTSNAPNSLANLLDTYLEGELYRWGSWLDVLDPSTARPVQYSTSDFILDYVDFRDDDTVQTVACFNAEECHALLSQITMLTRLRSTFMRSRNTRESLEKAVLYTATRGFPARWSITTLRSSSDLNQAGQEEGEEEGEESSADHRFLWSKRPSWWGASQDDPLKHDLALLESVLVEGYSGIVRNFHRMMPGQYQESLFLHDTTRSTSKEQEGQEQGQTKEQDKQNKMRGLTRAALQERVEQLTIQLIYHEDVVLAKHKLMQERGRSYLTDMARTATTSSTAPRGGRGEGSTMAD